MNTTISFEPETLTVEENLFEEILRAADVVRHEVVSRIIKAYDKFEVI